MSEPMSAVEIEDVLSSIRKLVSDELRPQPRAQAPDPAGKGDSAGERLILTPALRVVAPTAAPPPDGEAEVSLTIGRLADAIGAAQRFESETGDPAPDELPAPVAALAPDEARAPGGLHFYMPEEALFAEVEDEDPAAPWDGAGLASGEGDLLVFRSRQHEPAAPIAGPAEADDAVAEAFARVVAEVLVETIAEEAQSAQRSAPATGVEADDLVWTDEAEAELLAELDRDLEGVATPVGESDPQPEAANARVTGAIATDPEALREMVRQMIREELQGSLGERITRNVRKLVRAEIARAMTLHDID